MFEWSAIRASASIRLVQTSFGKIKHTLTSPGHIYSSARAAAAAARVHYCQLFSCVPLVMVASRTVLSAAGSTFVYFVLDSIYRHKIHHAQLVEHVAEESPAGFVIQSSAAFAAANETWLLTGCVIYYHHMYHPCPNGHQATMSCRSSLVLSMPSRIQTYIIHVGVDACSCHCKRAAVSYICWYIGQR